MRNIAVRGPGRLNWGGLRPFGDRDAMARMRK